MARIAALKPPPPQGLPNEIRRPVILVADDDRTIRYLYRQALEAGGFGVIEAENGADALVAFERFKPSITLLDIMMPIMDGFAACAALRATESGRHAPVLLATRLDDASSIQRAYDAGATDFISKPINWPVLVHRLRYMLRADDTFRRYQESERRLAEAQRIASLGNFIWYPQPLGFEGSDGLRSILGLEARGPLRVRAILRQIEAGGRTSLIDAIRTALRDHSPLQCEFCVSAHGQDMRHVELRGEIARDAAGRVAVQGTVQDISERKQIEAALIAARAAAESADAVKTALLTGMNHELRTPLNAIIGFSEIISGEIFGPVGEARYRQFATDILHAGHHMLDLVTNVLDMARLASDQYDMKFEPANLRALAEDAIVNVKNMEPARGRTIALVGWHSATLAKVDGRAVKQMLVHLLGNAAKFSGTETPVDVTCDKTASGEIWVSVVDRGVGMTPEEVAIASEPFRQIDGRLARKYEGLGIGLSIVEKLIACHRGRLTIESRRGVGSRFSLVFPAALALPTPL